MQVNFDGHDVTRPYDDVVAPCFQLDCSKCLNCLARLHTREKLRHSLERKRRPPFLRLPSNNPY